MNNPEYNERQINKELAAKAPELRISVKWDGNSIDADSDATFDVFVGDNESPFFISDDGHSFDLFEIKSRAHHVGAGWGTSPSDIAAATIVAIRDALSEGLVFVEEED